MARSRNIKPGFYKNEVLGELPFEFRLLFIGLWTHADREGRFEYRPRRIKAELFPYDSIDVEDGIAALADGGFLLVYEVNGEQYVQIKNWAKHQNPHHKEVGSTIPSPPGHIDRVCPGYIPLSNTIRRRIYERDGRKCRECGAEHGLSIDHIIPVTKGGNSTDDNLQVLCLGCNARKGNRILMHEPCMADAQAKQVASSPLIPDSLNSDSKEGTGAARQSTRGKKCNLIDWLVSQETDAVPANDPIYSWARSAGVPGEWIALAWMAFENRYGADGKDKDKTYTDWRAVFRSAVKEDWLRLWRKGRDGWELTTAGESVRLEMEAANV
jgi:hypothetical protein